VTSGNWEVHALHGADEDFVYFSGTKDSPIGLDIYRVKFDGSGLERLSKTDGTHRASFSKACSYFIDTWSDATTPPQTRLHRADGSVVRVLNENKVDTLS